jgi:hypothetical protein
VLCERGPSVKDKKSTLPKKAGVLKKKPKKKPAAHAIVFTYAHGKETVRTTRRKSGKS